MSETSESVVECNFPFPQSIDYEGVIKPNNVTQEQMNESVIEFYEYWKEKYVRESNGNTEGGGYYVNMKGTGGDGNEITTSEAHGYGMMIFAYMAGYDDEAKEYFDGMFNMFDQHRSVKNKVTMSWKIDKSEDRSKDTDSATDGDLDIAFALLLADKQWGSDEENGINYLSEATHLIYNGIKGGDIDTKTYRIKLGDWQKNKYNTRPSDWMTDHFTVFERVTGDDFWEVVNDTTYDLIEKITENYSDETGLMPDFVVGHHPKPAKPNFLEEKTDGDFSWNACRYPWRIALDYILNGDERSKNAATKVSDWIISSSGGKMSKIYAGYKLNGKRLVDYQESAFIAPFVVAAMVNSDNQKFVNKGWKKISNWKSEYFEDSINLLCQLVLSGNYWVPA